MLFFVLAGYPGIRLFLIKLWLIGVKLLKWLRFVGPIRG